MENNTGFTQKEKRRYHMKKYIREHLFDFFLKLICNCLAVWLILYLCEGKRFALGIGLAALYTVVKAVYRLRWYRKDYLKAEFPKGESI